MRKVPRFLPLAKSKLSASIHSPGGGSGGSKRKSSHDENYLQENKAVGELDMIGVESLIDLSDVSNKSKK